MNNTKKLIGSRINSALALRGMKQKELARILGVTDNTVSYYVSGARTPNAEQIIAIANALDVSADYLLGLSTIQSTKYSNYLEDNSKIFIELAHEHFGLYDEIFHIATCVLNSKNLTNEQINSACEISEDIIRKTNYYLQKIDHLSAEIDKYIDSYSDFYKNHKIITNKRDKANSHSKSYIIEQITKDYLGIDGILTVDPFLGFNRVLCENPTESKQQEVTHHANDHKEE